MTSDELLDRFEAGIRSPELPFVANDEVEVLHGVYVGERGTVDLVACSEVPIQFLVDFGDGTDEYFPASALRLVNRDA